MSDRVWLVRHGRTNWNMSGHYLGSSDIDLDEVGLQQAHGLASWAAQVRVDMIVTSPARRAMRTAAAVGTQLGTDPRIDDRLHEVDFGIAEGRTLADLARENPQVVAQFELDPVGHHFPGGEDPRRALSRIRAAVTDVVRLDAARPLVVTHGTVLRLLLCDILQVPLTEYRRLMPIAENCAITELSVTDDKLALRRFNAPPCVPEVC
ncbi:MAG TPA: histidine phosphatase family protein [Chloroflexota bacterium]|jgi:probable phosphoglycerate mutase